MVIPAKTMAEIVRVLPDNQKETITIEYDANQILFTYNDIQLFSRLLEGSFPDYKQIIPKSTRNTAIISRDELTKAVRVSSIFSENTTSIIHISIDETTQTLTIKATSSQIGENEAVLTAEVKGEGSISFNGSYLLDATTTLDDEKLKLSINDELSPGVLTPITEDTKGEKVSYAYIVMPIRT
jgi:DNA polymerase-3 subunit beta